MYINQFFIVRSTQHELRKLNKKPKVSVLGVVVLWGHYQSQKSLGANNPGGQGTN